MTVVFLESLTFGLDLVNEAAEELDQDIVLLTGVRRLYVDLSKYSRISVCEIDTFNQPEVLAKLKEINPRAIVSNTDTWMIDGARYCQALNLPGRSLDFAKLTRSKSQIRNRLQDQNWILAKSHEVQKLSIETTYNGKLSLSLSGDPKSSINLPVIIKPNDGTGSSNINVVHTGNDLHEFKETFASKSDVIIEPYRPGPLWSAEVFVYDNSCTVLGFTGRHLSPEPLSREEAFFFPAMTGSSLHPKATKWVIELLQNLRAEDGYYHIEFTYWENEFYLIEVNPRMGGALICYALETVLNFNPYRPLMELALWRSPQLPDEISHQGAYASWLVYAKRPGVIRTFQVPKLEAYPGSVHVRFSKVLGDEIVSIDSQSGSFACLASYAETVEDALNFVQAVSRAIDVVVE